jgi:RNA polymerase sigma factor for flagellar operon FliA
MAEPARHQADTQAAAAPLARLSDPGLRALYGGWIKRLAMTLKVRMPWAELDELLQWGAVGMLEALTRFDAGHGVEFQAFAARRIRGAMIDGLRRDGAQRRGEAYLEADEVDNAAWLSGNSPDDPLALLQAADQRTHLAAALKRLAPAEFRVLALHFYEDLNNREIAAVLAISEGYASRLRSRALASLAVHLRAVTKGESLP